MSSFKSEKKQQTLWIEFSSPKTANAFGGNEAKELQKLKAQLKGCSTLVWRSSLAEVFCSGGNLKDYAKQTRQESARTNQLICKSLDQFSRWPVFKIAIVSGDCIGGGLELLSCFDFVLASSASRFNFWQRRIGLIYGWGGFARLAPRMGALMARQAPLLANSMCAWQAQQLGLVDQVCPTSTLDENINVILAAFRQWPTEPVAPLTQLEQKNEAASFGKLWLNPSHHQALKKFSAGSKSQRAKRSR